MNNATGQSEKGLSSALLSDKIGDMDKQQLQQFQLELKESVRIAKIHSDYCDRQSSKYHQRHYRLRAAIGLSAIAGVILTAFETTRIIGSFISAFCAFTTVQILPFLKWDETVQAFKESDIERKRILYGYRNILSTLNMYDRSEILVDQKSKIQQLEELANQNDKKLPKDLECWELCRREQQLAVENQAVAPPKRDAK
jgi:hypothetical protein